MPTGHNPQTATETHGLKGVHPDSGPVLVFDVTDVNLRCRITQGGVKLIFAHGTNQCGVIILAKNRLNLAAGPEWRRAGWRLKQRVVFGIGDGDGQSTAVFKDLFNDINLG
jgi:hypothetical protein